MVGFNRRFDPHFMAVRRAIDEGQIRDSGNGHHHLARSLGHHRPNIFGVQAVFSET